MDKVEDTEFNSGTVVAAKLGDQAAFETIYLTHAPAVSGYARGHGAEDPEALANETMYRVLRDIATFDGTTQKFRSWVFTIAHNLIIDDQRRTWRRPVTVELDESASTQVNEGADQAALDRLEAQQLLRWISELSPDQRNVLLLRLVSDLPIAEVARILRKREGAVKALHWRGMAALRRRIDGQAITKATRSTFTEVL